MEKTINNFQTVLERLILPKFSSLTEIDILTGMVEHDRSSECYFPPVFRVQVDYSTKNDLKNKELREIEQETRSLFRMMGFPVDADLRIFFIKEKG